MLRAFRIGASSPFHKALIAFLAGIVSTLAMPPLFLWPVLFITLTLLVRLLDLVNEGREVNSTSRTLWRAALIGWSFGFGYFLSGLYWIGASFLVEAEKFALLMPVAVLLLTAALACFYAVPLGLAALVWTKGPLRIITFAAALLLADAARSYLFTGLPWNLLGHSLTGSEALRQAITLYGLIPLTAIAALCFAAPAALFSSKAKGGVHAAPATIMLLAISLLTLGGLYGFGAWRLGAAGETKYNRSVELLLIAPNVPQKEKVTPALRPKAFERMITLTEKELQTKGPEAGPGKTRIIIWPETAIPYAMNQKAPIIERLSPLLTPGTLLITGGFWLEKKEQPAHEADRRDYKLYNSLFVLNQKGEITARYDKHHLVPFGEYLPYPELLSAIGLEALVRLRGGFNAGPPPAPMPLAGAPAFLPYICYEAIFPLNSPKKTKAAAWILNISNDAWFGRTAGPHQHNHLAGLRAVETGLPVIRVVNNGITSVYDGYGRLVNQTTIGQTGAIHTALPSPASPPFPAFPAHLLIFLHLIIIYALISVMNYFDRRG